MAKTKTKKVINRSRTEWDSVFILKLVLFLILGSQWLYIIDGTKEGQLSFPIGAVIGLAFALHDHFKIDRKIEFAVILVAMFVGYWLPMGITIVR